MSLCVSADLLASGRWATLILWRKGLISGLAYITGLQGFTKFVKTVCMLVSTSQKRSHLNSCDLNLNVNDVEIPLCETKFLVFL